MTLIACSACKSEKDVSSFYFADKEKTRIKKPCKECVSVRSRKYYVLNRENLKGEARSRYYNSDAYSERIIQLTLIKNRSEEDIKERVRASRKKREKNPNVVKYRREYRKTEEVKARAREYASRPEVKAARAERARLSRKSDPMLQINNRMSCGIRQSLKGLKDGKSWEKIVGYSRKDLATHLERQFTAKMGWSNMAEWHIDHIIPLSSFSYESVESPEFKAAWAMTNLRPICKYENMSKKNKRTHLI